MKVRRLRHSPTIARPHPQSTDTLLLTIVTAVPTSPPPATAVAFDADHLADHLALAPRCTSRNQVLPHCHPLPHGGRLGLPGAGRAVHPRVGQGAPWFLACIFRLNRNSFWNFNPRLTRGDIDRMAQTITFEEAPAKGSGGMYDTRDPEPFEHEDKRKSISAAPSFEVRICAQLFFVVATLFRTHFA